MHRLSSTFILGYHGCDRRVGERLLRGESFRLSDNNYDWLGPGIYFWESNPRRGLDFAHDASARKNFKIARPFVVGAVIELGLCLDLTTSAGIKWVQSAYNSLSKVSQTAGRALPANSTDRLRRYLDCAVMRRLHHVLEESGYPPVDTVKGVFLEGVPAYPTAGFDEKTHIQIAVRNANCIKGVFRVPSDQLA